MLIEQGRITGLTITILIDFNSILLQFILNLFYAYQYSQHNIHQGLFWGKFFAKLSQFSQFISNFSMEKNIIEQNYKFINHSRDPK